MSEQQTPPTTIERLIKPAVVATSIVIAATLIWPFVAWPGSPNYVEVGNWLSGVVQPVAVLWFVLAFLLQHEELKLQRRDLADTREELAKQASATVSAGLTAKRTLFTTLRPEIFKQLDDTLPATVIWLKGNNLWREESGSSVRLVSLNFASALRGTERGSPTWTFMRSMEFADRSEHYCRTMEALLSLATESDGDGQLFTDLVRSTEYFGFYRQLRLMLAQNLNLHPSARGARPGDVLLHEWNGVTIPS